MALAEQDLICRINLPVCEYPTGIDAFVNPLPTDMQSSPDHARQHAKANDAIYALENTVGAGGLLSARFLGVAAKAADSDLLDGHDTGYFQAAGNYITALTGNVTASGPGSVAATISDEAVTYAKMQHVSATDRLLGRISALAGDVEEVTCTDFAQSILDDANAATTIATLGLDANLATFALPANTTISVFGASLIDDANEAAFKATVNLEIGVDVQAYNSNLTGIDQALDTTASPTFNQGNFTTLHTTTILADHIGEHVGAHTVVFDNNITISTKNIITDTSTGTQIGTGATQKLGFFGAATVVQQLAATDLGTVLSNLGLRAAGTAYPLTTTAAVKFDHIGEATGAHTIVCDNIVSMPSTSNVTQVVASGEASFKIYNSSGTGSYATLYLTPQTIPTENLQVYRIGGTNGNAAIANTGTGSLHLQTNGVTALTIASGGAVTCAGSVASDTDSTDNLGSSSVYWANTYTDALLLNSTATLGGATAGVITGTGALTCTLDLGLVATKKIYLDGVARTGNTYLVESSADILDIYAGGGNILKLGVATATFVAGATVKLDHIAEITAAHNIVHDHNIQMATAKSILFVDTSQYLLNFVTAATWGIYWNTTDNKIEFHNAGTAVADIDLDSGVGSFGGLSLGDNMLANFGASNQGYIYWNTAASKLVIGVN